MRTPINRGSAGYALLAAGPSTSGEPEGVTLVRKRGYATSAGEIETGAYGVAAPIPNSGPRACLNLITFRKDQIDAAEKWVADAAQRVGRACQQAQERLAKRKG